ncbi:MAG: hypothetical protein QXO47_10435 [Thermoproteota archaeon]
MSLYDTVEFVRPNFVNPLVRPQIGQIFTLLDPVRDAQFLSFSSTDALGNTIPDAGLGVVDNGWYFYTTRQAPPNVTKADEYGNRLYPVKFFWMGSPRGTNAATNNFSIFCADVDLTAFYTGAPASVYLVNPRLVLSVLQAGKDIINWFDANYPYTSTPASGGVGQETPRLQQNTTYGILSFSGDPGNVSRMASLSSGASIDGQIWPVYDYVDNSIILYFSIKTPNPNSKAIYAYKTLDSEITSPLTSSQFLGGVYNTIYNFGTTNGSYGPTNMSSHIFSVTTPDPLVTQAIVSGKQQAVIAYSYTLETNYINPDYGNYLQAGFLADIHGSPINWNSAQYYLYSNGFGMDNGGLNNVDKLGNIIPVGTQFSSGSYAVLFSALSMRERRLGERIIDAMQVRVGYLQFTSYAQSSFVYGDPLIELSGPESIGHCRPQYTTLPDGLPKIVYNTFNFDQSLKTVYQYIDPAKLRPENNKRLIYTNSFAGNPFSFPTYQKKKAIVLLGENLGAYNDPAKIPSVVEVQEFYGNNDSGGIYAGAVMNNGTLIPVTQLPYFSLGGQGNGLTVEPVVGFFELEDLPPFIAIQQYGNNVFEYVVVVLED